jgi:hypothetical protein
MEIVAKLRSVEAEREVFTPKNTLDVVYDLLNFSVIDKV